MAISDKVKNIIQTASSSIAALKWKLGGEGRTEGRLEDMAFKRNWAKFTLSDHDFEATLK